MLEDGKLILQESGAITECVRPTLVFYSVRSNENKVGADASFCVYRYLCEKYDTSHRLLPEDMAQRTKVRQWIHAAEGTFMVHCLPKIYVNRISSAAAKELSTPLAAIVARDLDWLESELKAEEGRFLVGDTVAAADVMMLFSVQFVFANALAGERAEQRWEGVERWLRACEGEEAYRRAVEKTGYRIEPQILQ